MTEAPLERRIEDEAGVEIRITPAVRRNLESLERMYREFPAAEASLGLPPVTDEDLQDWLGALVETARDFVAVVEGTVVGHVAYTPRTEDYPDLLVFVTPDYQGRGIGTVLVCHVLETAEADDVEGFVSYVERDNEAAIALYGTLGFEELTVEPAIIKMGIDLDRAVAEGASERIEGEFAI